MEVPSVPCIRRSNVSIVSLLLPMPEFDEALFPSFAAGVPALPPSSVADSGRCKISVDSRVSLYFLDNAGGLNGRVAIPTEFSSGTERSAMDPSRLAVGRAAEAPAYSPSPCSVRHLPSHYRCRRSIAPCFLPSTPACRRLHLSLRSKRRRCQSRSDTASSFYFLEDQRPAEPLTGKYGPNPSASMSHPAAVGDLNFRGSSSMLAQYAAISRFERTCERPSADLAGQCRDHAEAAERHRPHFVFLRTRELEYPSCRS